MKMLDELMDYLKERKKHLGDFLREECHVDTEKLLENQINTAFSGKLHAKTLKELKVACIMDRFTLDSYKPECNLLELTPDGWKKEIDEFKPELIFIESAWQGKDGLWYRKIANGSTELYRMTSYCHQEEIPVIFWNKEDPVYTDTFMPAARCADFVFTTDIDCIKKYKNALGHDNVYFLHFAAQPAMHNPIEKYERKNKFCFAGAYYHKYPNRAKTFDEFSKVFIEMCGLDIYDRNYNAQRPEHAFPEFYNPYIIGCLDPADIDIAYKGYNYGINMNSVEQSQTMFARRVFEMLASNTVTVGNFSRGVKNLFGDLTICTSDALTLKNCLHQFCFNNEAYRKYRLLGLRRVLENHLYEDRLNYIVKKVYGTEIKSKQPEVLLIARPDSEDYQKIIDTFNKQTYQYKKLLIIGDFEQVNDSQIIILSEQEAEGKSLSEYGDADFFGILNGNNYYGINYLKDLVLTVRYAEVNGIGKGYYHKYDGQKCILEGTDVAYKYVPSLKADRSIFRKTVFAQYNLKELLFQDFVKGNELFSVDEFNFCENYSKRECSEVDDAVIYDQGISLKEIEETAEEISRDEYDDSVVILNYEKIKEYCRDSAVEKISFSVESQSLLIKSKLEDREIKYVYFKDWFDVKKYQKNGKLNFQFSGMGDVDTLGVCIFYDINKAKVAPVFTKLNTLSINNVPENAAFFKLGLRISGHGSCNMKEVLLGLEHSTNDLSCFLSRNRILVLSNQYPSPRALYRNMFVHKRIMAYKEEGLLCDVMRMNTFCNNEFSEFEGINIIEGYADRLGNILESGKIDTVCVHFLDRSMWEILKHFDKKIRILVWLHGAEIQPWWRREYNYTTKSELEKAKIESAERQEFWKEIFEEIDNYNIHFVFVSQYFADEIFEDNHIKLPEDRYSIIHNCIDTDMFNYIRKSPEQRKQLLSIRPYASNKYANDLTVKCIEKLSEEPFFEELHFLIMGNGDQFERVTAPLKKFSNVTLEKRFLRQEEIAQLHKEYGIFITPTRMDAQGVSRDEAMSSGLVPITNAVTAIPEFVDETCGIMAPGEDYMQMAEGIRKLFSDEKLFEEMSENAAMRVRKQSSKKHTICKEIALIQYE